MQSIDKYFDKSSKSSSTKRISESPSFDSCKKRRKDNDDASKVDNETENKAGIDKQDRLRKIKSIDLNVDYGVIFSKRTSDQLFSALEQEIQYDAPTKIKIFGKEYDVNRKVTCYGDEGLAYMYSGVLNKAKPWPYAVLDIKTRIEDITKKVFNFVLVNRYENGLQYMGEHRDDEKDLDHTYPIASVSLGQHRDFTFRHKDSRGKGKTGPANVKVLLQHGSLLVMNPPTNFEWYHGLPKRAISVAPGVRINLTFRRILVK